MALAVLQQMPATWPTSLAILGPTIQVPYDALYMYVYVYNMYRIIRRVM